MNRVLRAAATSIALVFAAALTAGAEVDRSVLPIQAPEPPRYTELDARNVKAPAPFVVEAPEGAPNVVIVLIDDIGFGGPSTFGGPIQTPTLDRLAGEGLRFNNFHTTALCSPSLTGSITVSLLASQTVEVQVLQECVGAPRQLDSGGGLQWNVFSGYRVH